MNTGMTIVTATALVVVAGATAVAQAQDKSTQTRQEQMRNQQQAAQPQPNRSQQEPAQQCLKDLASLGQKMEQDGYWLTGWGDRRGMVATPPATATAPPRTAGPPATYPWGPQAPYGMNSPRYQINVLHAAAVVLGHRGDQQACDTVVGELRDLYDTHVKDLRSAGVEPGDIRSWRQERITAAKPIGQLGVPLTIQEVTGTEIRNAKDQRLGTVDDVVLDPQSGQITFVVVERGGFLGIGRKHVLLPWNALQATPNLNTFVLNVDEEVMDKAPQVDGDRVGDRGVYGEQRQQAEEYWRDHTQG